jgi:acetyl esterase/lipase
MAVEYPGYSIYKGKVDGRVVREDALWVYQYMTEKMGFRQEDVIVMGRSIGTGVALELMKKVKPGALVLISPFVSVKSLAR